MKLVLFIVSVLALPVAAHAEEVLNPPGGPVYVEADYRVAQPEQKRKNRQLRRALMEQFDENGDGRLGPRERARAIRVLQRIQAKLAGKQAGRPKMQRFIQRFDTNRDGNVDQREMPPGQARRLRRLDRDRDGWIEPGEVR